MSATVSPAPHTVVLHVGGLHYATEKVVVEQVLAHRPGVIAVDANPVAQTATVDVRPRARRRSRSCAAGSRTAATTAPVSRRPATSATRWSIPTTAPHDHAAVERADDAHGHGHGGHAGMSMEAMARDMRNRFLVALLFTVPIVAWSMVGTKLLGTELATPFGIDRDVWLLLLSLPVVLYASSIFFTGALVGAARRGRST